MEGFVTCPMVQDVAQIYSGVGCQAYGHYFFQKFRTGARRQWATGNPCMSHSIELVQGLSRSSRISYIAAAVPPVLLPSHCSGQQTLSVAAEPRSRGGGARPPLPLRPLPLIPAPAPGSSVAGQGTKRRRSAFFAPPATPERTEHKKVSQAGEFLRTCDAKRKGARTSLRT